MRFSTLSFLMILLATGPATEAVSQTLTAETELASDRWHYPYNFTNGTRPTGALFILNATDAMDFNRRDGMAIFQWNVALPEGFAGPYRVSSARLRFWDRKQAAYVLGSVGASGVEGRLELFAARFKAPYSDQTWQGTEPYVGGGVGSASGPHARNPYPIDLITGASVENEIFTSTAWALGEPQGYTPGAMTDAFPIDFHLDVNDPTIQAELQADLATGKSSWFVSATFDLDVIDATQVPQVLFQEGRNLTGFGASQQPPSLILEIESPALSVEAWELYR
jgi:hypothetical protein